jgi:hypothetical protein
VQAIIKQRILFQIKIKTISLDSSSGLKFSFTVAQLFTNYHQLISTVH